MIADDILRSKDLPKQERIIEALELVKTGYNLKRIVRKVVRFSDVSDFNRMNTRQLNQVNEIVFNKTLTDINPNIIWAGLIAISSSITKALPKTLDEATKLLNTVDIDTLKEYYDDDQIEELFDTTYEKILEANGRKKGVVSNKNDK